MGVQGLWELLTPVGRRVSVDSLGNKKLAIDASIWIIQFMKGMRDENGDMIRNAHLLGFFRRICKLLFLRIKPVFVFDGATPVLKRRTLIARRRQRENAQFKIRKTAEKLLLNHIRSRKLEEIASEINSGERRKTPNQPSSQTTEICDQSSGAGTLQGSLETAADQVPGRSSFYEKSNQEAADALLAASLAAEYDPNTEAENDLVEETIEAGDEDNEIEELVLPSNVKGVDPAVLASLPASMQLELLVQMREQLVAENRKKFEKVSKVPSSFSQLQIQAYLKTVAFRREITEAQRAAGGGGVGGVPTSRIASSSDREFIFSNSFQGEKPAPSMIEEQRRSQQATRGTNKVVSFPGSKPTLFPAITRTQKSSVEEVPEEGVVSLVSTEVETREPDSSTSSVHTYVDAKGHVRVSRVRGMGVRMTRDLQWNLYLMKDIEARKNLASGTSSNPPIIPSNRVDDAPVSVVKNDFDRSDCQEGLHISFVDDGNSDYSKDVGLFEELFMMKGKEADTKSLEGSSFHGKHEEHSRLSNNEEEDDFEWEEGVVDKGLDCSVVDEKAGHFEVSEVSPSASKLQDSGDVMVQCTKEEEGQNADVFEDGGFGVDYSVVEDEDLAQAMKLSLMVKEGGGNTEEPNEDVILEDGPSSDESEVEWEDGTGAVTVTGFDAVTAVTDLSKIQSDPSEEAQIQEAIRRSLEDFCPPARVSSQLVIKEPSHDNPNSAAQSNEAATLSPFVRAEAESEELFLARERTRKGKALLGEVGNEPRQYVPNICEMTTAEEENCAEMICIKPAYIEDGETMSRANENNSNNDDKKVERTAAEPYSVLKAEKNYYSHPDGCVSVSEQIVDTHVEFAPASTESVISGACDFRVSPAHYNMPRPNDKNPLLEQESVEQEVPSTIAQNVATQLAVGNNGGSQKVVLRRFAGQDCTKPPDKPSQSCPSSDLELLRDAEEIDIVKDREELRLKEAQLLFEREQLAREEEKLQAELEAEREEIQAGLDRERELLAREEMELRATQKKNERNAESVTGEMFSDVQELLRMFGIPYAVAPMEAEAQCAYLDANNLVDGVVTEDSDVFLFGGQNVYKNLFDDRKYVETYYTKDLESEMGMNREKLIRMALLLGSDYTEGISGIGIVNAIEVVNAFEEDDGLQKFRMALDSLDLSIFNKYRRRAKVKSKGRGRGKGKSSEADGEYIEEDEVSEGGDLDQTQDNRFTPRQRIFISQHRAVSKNWNIPDSFPSAAVIAAYVSPMIDKSLESFSFGRPDIEALRSFCFEKFGWNKDKADELLLPVLKEHDRRETQTRLDSFYHFSQRFAKIRSRRIQKAVTGITGRRSEELMEIPPHLLISSPATKRTKKSKTSKFSEIDDEMNVLSGFNEASSTMVSEPTSMVDGAHDRVFRVGRGRSGRGRERGQIMPTAGEVEDEEDVENDKQEQNSTKKKIQCRGKGEGKQSAKTTRGRRKGKDKGSGSGSRGKGNDSEADESFSDAGKSDEVTEDCVGDFKSLKRNASQITRRSTRRSSETNCMLDNSDEDAGGACSDGEIQAAKLREKSTQGMKEIPEGLRASSSEHFSKVGNLDLQIPASQKLSQAVDYDTSAGFCRQEGEGSGEAGQLHFEKEELSYLARGGGFCLDEDEVSPENLDSDMSGVKGQEQQQPSAILEALLYPREKEVVATASEIAEHNYNQVIGSEQLESRMDGSSNSTSSRRVVADEFTTRMKQSEEGGEPVELGLRAIPMMRRKKRKTG